MVHTEISSAWLWAMLITFAVMGSSSAIGDTETLSEIAEKFDRPSMAPKASDVTMRTLRFRPRNSNDPQDTMKSLDEFHGTRLEWVYLDSSKSDQEYVAKVKASNRVFGCTGSGTSYVGNIADTDWNRMIGLVDLNGNQVIARHKRGWTNPKNAGCVNKPEYERGHIAYYKKLVDAGAEVLQRDEPGMNYGYAYLGGGFCSYCMKAFREYVKQNVSTEKQRELGIDDIETFDYSDALRKQGAPAGDEFGRWNGGELKTMFVEFQRQSTTAFLKRLREEINEYAGRTVPFSCNNTSFQKWEPYHQLFDFGLSELMLRSADPKHLWERAEAGRELGKIQVFSMPKKAGKEISEEDLEALTRKVIATSYAVGGLCRVPWDIFMQSDDGRGRYFGKPEQYADLYGFVRSNEEYLDGHEDAATFGKGIEDERHGNNPPVMAEGGTGMVYAFARAQPGRQDAPVVVHLIDWGEEAKPFTLKLRTESFSDSGAVRVKLLVAPKYNSAAHAKAEQSKDYSSLSKTMDIKGRVMGEFTVVEIPALNPAGLLVVSKE